MKLFDIYQNVDMWVESFVGINVWTMLFAWCNLLIIYLFLKKILFVPIKNMIDSRQKEVDDMYENAENAETDAKAMCNMQTTTPMLSSTHYLHRRKNKCHISTVYIPILLQRLAA